jgi:hypothetical protein
MVRKVKENLIKKALFFINKVENNRTRSLVGENTHQ